MKIIFTLLLIAYVRASTEHIENVAEEDNLWYNLIVQEQISMSIAPTPLPSPEPSPEPTPLPSRLPSPEPSPEPSQEPTEEPTPAPQCGLDLDIQTSCVYSCKFDVCVERPYRMQMRYNGGGCSGTEFRRCPGEDPDPCTCQKEVLPRDQWNNKNTCEDYDDNGVVCTDLDANGDPVPGCGPPPRTINHTVWIEAFGKDEPYYKGTVLLNSRWNANTVGEKVQANTDIFTYEYIPGVGRGRLLQHVVFHSSCSQEMFLTDQFGAQQLLEFDSYCTVDCSDPGCKEVVDKDGNAYGRRRISLFGENIADLSINLKAGSATDGDVELSTVLGLLTPTESNIGTQFENFTDIVNGVIVPPDISLVPETFTFDVSKNYSLAAIVVGFLPDNDGKICQDTGFSDLYCVKVETLPNTCTGTDNFIDGDKKAGGVGNSTVATTVETSITTTSPSPNKCLQKGDACDLDKHCCSGRCRLSTCSDAYKTISSFLPFSKDSLKMSRNRGKNRGFF